MNESMRGLHVDESSTMVLSAVVGREGEKRLCVVGTVGTIDAVVGAGSWARMCASKLTNACCVYLYEVAAGGYVKKPSRVLTEHLTLNTLT